MDSKGLKLVRWYAKNGRSFPWRYGDPYHILVSQFMLQRTTAEQVSSCFEEFIRDFPTIVHCARADIKKIKNHFKGLGLVSRARLLKQAAVQIYQRKSGQIPCDKKELLKLKGIGEYSASAILVLAFGAQLPMVDTNVRRIISRLLGTKVDEKVASRVCSEIMPRGKAKEFNLALLDLSSMICTPKDPECFLCPLNDGCLGRESGG